jgi:SAM-dependent methyltransferase
MDQIRVMDWDEKYRKEEIPWDRGLASLPLREYLDHHPQKGRALIPGCGRGHEVALAVEHGLDAMGLDIAPAGIAAPRSHYPHLQERFIVGDLFHPPPEIRDQFDLVLEHTCLCALPPSLRKDYRKGIDLLLKHGGLLIGVWYMNPDRDPDHDGPPYPLQVNELTSLFAEGYEMVDDFIPDVAFEGREGRERLRVLRRI